MDRGIKPVIVLSAEILMNSWYTLESVARKCDDTAEHNPHTLTHTSCLSRWIVLNRDGRNLGGIKGLF